MKLTPEGRRRLQGVVRQDLASVLGDIAKEITAEVRNYVARTLYARPKSLYYERDKEDGGFLETFAANSSYAELLDSMTRVQGNKMYITFVLRDYDNINYEGRGKGKFGHHVSFDGEETNNSRFSSELDNLMNDGWGIYSRSGIMIKYIAGIHFKEYAKSLVKKYTQQIVDKKLREKGYNLSGNVGVGRKRLSIPIDTITIEVNEEE